MWMSVLAVAAFMLMPQEAEAQLFKKLFGKKKKAVVEQPVVASEPEQTVMLPVDSLEDHANNRNGFLGIPLGIPASSFENQLIGKGFTEVTATSGKSYMYQGSVLEQDATVRLALTEQTGRVYAVAVELAEHVVAEADAKRLLSGLRGKLAGIYGKGYVEEGGSIYVIVTRLGTVRLSYERMVDAGYGVSFMVDDAKAYALAYQEMEDKENEELPRALEHGLAPACCHSGIVGLATLIMEGGTLQKARQLLRDYDYAVGKERTKDLPATFSLPDGYKAVASIAKRGRNLVSVTISAHDDVQAIQADLARYGYTLKGKTYSNGKLTASLTQDKQGRDVLVLTKAARRK
jgi:hypothetical protein